MSHTIALPSVLTAQVVGTVQTQLVRSMQAAPQGQGIVLQASGVQSFDSAGLALLLACRRAAQAQGRVLRVQGWTPSLQSLAQVYGVMPLLDPEAAAAVM
ncbi:MULTISPECIES: lipid asymmetry maintenance protein MlaB [unclassified Comamonas]|jgi:phospholipid transport system transporter-binding protein|uniref:STAS domain-containing protein n=1 Tax=unclassified Comamonas TaxID=2638500 RepID=UPI0017807BDB|nr:MULTISPECIES: STAS domain-containing protein [unclassified Comamonas]MBD9401237.1 STAS domain-containing protein [Comamonas sp. CMM02]